MTDIITAWRTSVWAASAATVAISPKGYATRIAAAVDPSAPAPTHMIKRV